ncbi:amidase [Streptomyces sp. IBSBF 2435]|uniref:amidase n=1 Tax=Streptomyces sp. IBSBF 2435 TaxID=2903531 RepID=UPI002FDC07AB
MSSTLSPDSSIAQLGAALADGVVTSVELVAMFADRIAAYDRANTTLNSVPVLNPGMFAEARAADLARARGEVRGPLHGIPFTVKDSYKVAGMTVAAGSPAFRNLVAREDSAAVSLLRRAGAVLIGRTTMPPMAAGGMQKGVHGRPASPFNPGYMPAAWMSGSSSGSGVAVSAALCTFSLGEETVSSGRSPASNNGVATYTPSRGLISVRGNWPLLALRDVVAPLARRMEDLLTLLDVLVQDDPDTAGDLWRAQPWVGLPPVSTVRPERYGDLMDPGFLRGKVIGVPRVFTGRDTSIDRPVRLRASIRELWERAEEDLRRLGATVVDVDVPAFYDFDKLKAAARDMADRGYWSPEFAGTEISLLAGAGWDEFLRLNADPALPALEGVDTAAIFPDEFYGADPVVNPFPRVGYDLVTEDAAGGSTPVLDVPGLRQAMEGLERFRKELLDDWMDGNGIDLLAFPANSDVAPADADVSLSGSLAAWAPGAAFSQGGWGLRALGIPAAQVSMGVTGDIGMPVGITFAGRAYSDSVLLQAAYAYEQATAHRVQPPHAPIGAAERLVQPVAPRMPPAEAGSAAQLRVRVDDYDGEHLVLTVTSDSPHPLESLGVTVDGVPLARVGVRHLGERIRVERRSRGPRDTVHSAKAGLVVARATLASGEQLGAFTEFDAPELEYKPAR